MFGLIGAIQSGRATAGADSGGPCGFDRTRLALADDAAPIDTASAQMGKADDEAAPDRSVGAGFTGPGVTPMVIMAEAAAR